MVREKETGKKDRKKEIVVEWHRAKILTRGRGPLNHTLRNPGISWVGARSPRLKREPSNVENRVKNSDNGGCCRDKKPKEGIKGVEGVIRG